MRTLLLTIALLTAFPAAAQERVMKFGTEGAYPPFNNLESDGTLTGFDVDIAKAMCEEMKAECTFVTQDWDGIIPALIAKKFDAIIASMSITAERKEQVDFSKKYYNTPPAIVVPKDSEIKEATPEALAGKSLGAQSSTVSASYLEEHYKDSDIKLYPTQDDAYLDLAAGRLDAVLADVGPTNLWLASEGGGCCAFIGEAVVKDDQIGIAVRKEDADLKEKINKAIAAIVANGTYKTINEKYFPFSIY